jgi:hypothetical protein
LSAKPTGNVTIGGTTYANVNFSSTIDLGLRVGSAKVSLNESTGAVSATDLDNERVKIEDKVKALKYFPVLGVGVGYRW